MSSILIVLAVTALFVSCVLIVSLASPWTLKDEEREVKDTAGNLVKVKIPTQRFSKSGSAMDAVFSILALIFAGILLLLVTPSSALIDTRQDLWGFFGHTSPDGAQSVFDGPRSFDASQASTSGTVTFKIPRGITPLWIVVTYQKDAEKPDSLIVPLEDVHNGTVSFQDDALKTADSIRAMYGTATGPSAEASWTKPAPTP